jgi:pilus assembly protein Flp/PilA
MLKFAGLVKALPGSLRRDDRGATMVEYGLLVVMIAIVVIPALIVLGPIVASWYTGVIGSL